MTVYERVEGGQVVERVAPIDGSNEDTRLGVAVLEGGQGGWRIAGAPEPEPAEQQATPATTDAEPIQDATSRPVDDPVDEEPKPKPQRGKKEQ